MPDTADQTHREPVQGVLVDLLMAVMDSLTVWSGAAGDSQRGLAWRDAVTARMVAHRSYAPYQDLVVVAARDLGFPVERGLGAVRPMAPDVPMAGRDGARPPDSALRLRHELFESVGDDRRAPVRIAACIRPLGGGSWLVQA
jgi:hypothetical protein